MRAAEVNTIIGNDRRTEREMPSGSPKPPSIGWMGMDEILHTLADSWTPVYHHRRPDLLQIASKVVAQVFGSPFTVQDGSVRHQGMDIPHMEKRQGKRLVVVAENQATPFMTVRTRGNGHGIIPSDFPAVGVGDLRTAVTPNLRHKGLPTEATLRHIAESITDAFQFVRTNGGKPEQRIPKSADHFVLIRGGDLNAKIHKQPLRSIAHQESEKKKVQQHRPRRISPGKDGITF